MSTAWHDSIYSLLKYKLLTSCPHPHAAPVKSRLCCRCSHGSILDRQQLPPKSSLSYSHHASFYLRASEKSGIPSVATKKLLKADENSTENGFSVSIKLPHSPHGQPKKNNNHIFWKTTMNGWFCQHLSANLQCSPTLSPPSPQNPNRAFLLPPTCPDPLSLSNPPLNHPGSEDGFAPPPLHWYLAPTCPVSALTPPGISPLPQSSPHPVISSPPARPVTPLPLSPFSRRSFPGAEASRTRGWCAVPDPLGPPSRGRGPPARLTRTGGAAALRPQGGAGSRAPAATTGRR